MLESFRDDKDVLDAVFGCGILQRAGAIVDLGHFADRRKVVGDRMRQLAAISIHDRDDGLRICNGLGIRYAVRKAHEQAEHAQQDQIDQHVGSMRGHDPQSGSKDAHSSSSSCEPAR